VNAGSAAVVKLLLEHGADASAACDAGSPVMWAAGSGKSATLEVLLQGGADPNTPGNANVTAALAASAAGTQFRKQCFTWTARSPHNAQICQQSKCKHQSKSLHAASALESKAYAQGNRLMLIRSYHSCHKADSTCMMVV